MEATGPPQTISLKKTDKKNEAKEISRKQAP